MTLSFLFSALFTRITDNLSETSEEPEIPEYKFIVPRLFDDVTTPGELQYQKPILVKIGGLIM